MYFYLVPFISYPLLTFLGHDLYSVEANDDLQRFFDFYAKGIENGWEKDTPRIRLTLLGYENSPARRFLSDLRHNGRLHAFELKSIPWMLLRNLLLLRIRRMWQLFRMKGIP